VNEVIAATDNWNSIMSDQQMIDIWRKAFAQASKPKSAAKHDEKVGETVSRAISRSIGSRLEMVMRPHIRMIGGENRWGS
jgi:hypothetical protein